MLVLLFELCLNLFKKAVFLSTTYVYVGEDANVHIFKGHGVEVFRAYAPEGWLILAGVLSVAKGLNKGGLSCSKPAKLIHFTIQKLQERCSTEEARNCREALLVTTMICLSPLYVADLCSRLAGNPTQSVGVSIVRGGASSTFTLPECVACQHVDVCYSNYEIGKCREVGQCINSTAHVLRIWSTEIMWSVFGVIPRSAMGGNIITMAFVVVVKITAATIRRCTSPLYLM